MTKEQFVEIFPRAERELQAYLDKYMLEVGIVEESDTYDFLATLSHESEGLTRWRENLNYSAKRLLEVFPKYFKSLDQAVQYQYNPEKIANRVYANRMGNGSEASGDGYKFCGRGPIQATGYDNYAFLSKLMGIDLIKEPGLLASNKELGIKAACYWYKANILNKV